MTQEQDNLVLEVACNCGGRLYREPCEPTAWCPECNEQFSRATLERIAQMEQRIGWTTWPSVDGQSVLRWRVYREEVRWRWKIWTADGGEYCDGGNYDAEKDAEEGLQTVLRYGTIAAGGE